MKDKIFVFSALLSGLFLGGCDKKAEEEKSDEFVQSDVTPEEPAMSEESDAAAPAEEAALTEEGQVESAESSSQAVGASDPALDTAGDDSGSVSDEG